MLNDIKRLLLVAAIIMASAIGSVAQDNEAIIDDGYLPNQADTIEVLSPKMGRMIKNTVVLPSQYFDEESADVIYPVIYLLNGHGGNYGSWGIIRPDLDYLASEIGAIFVCPDGQNSWYWDAADGNSQFETYVATELVGYIDDNYRTIRDPRMRAVCGYSMGGHGSLWLGMRHPDVFGICCSMSGGVDITPFPDSWNIKDILGEYSSNPDTWKQHTVMHLVESGIKNEGQKLLIDCGTEDFFLQVNRNLHKAMLDKKIPHDYIERPGAHNAEYWSNSLDYQLLFIQKAFNELEDTAE